MTHKAGAHSAENHEHTPPPVASTCLACGNPIEYKGRGRRPHYCSNACRHTAWARRQAAAEGLIASQVVELPSPAVQHYDDESVARWLARDAQRIVRVARIMRSTRTLGIIGTNDALAHALDSVRNYGGSPKEPTTKLEKHLANKVTELEENRQNPHHNLHQETITATPEKKHAHHDSAPVPSFHSEGEREPNEAKTKRKSSNQARPQALDILGTRGTKRFTLLGEELDEGQCSTDDNAVVMVEYHHPSGTHLVDEQWSDEECERYVRGLGDDEFFF